MLIRIKSDSLLKIYTADSICMETDAMFGNLSANTQEFLNTAVRLLAFLHKNEISTDDIYGEIAGDEESAVLCARELGKAGLFYIEKYKPQYVCSIRDDFLKDIKKVPGLVYNSFARRISDYIGNVRKIKPEELAYICSMRDDMKLTDGTAFAIIREFTDMDSRLTAYDITSMLDMNMSWTNISTVQANMASFKPDYLFVKKLMFKLGYTCFPSSKEIDYYRKWRDQWGFADPDILEVASTLVNGDYAMEYLDGALNNFREQGNVRNVRESLEESQTMKEMLRLVGGGKITKKNIMIYSELRKEWDADILLFAAKCAAGKGKGKDKWHQIQKLLDEWKANCKLNSLSDIHIYEGKKEGVLPF